MPFVGYRPKAPEPAAAAATTTPGIVKPVAASIDRGDDGASSDNQDDGDSDSDGSWKDDGDDSEDDYDDEGGARRRKGKKATKHRGVAGVTAGGSKGGHIRRPGLANSGLASHPVRRPGLPPLARSQVQGKLKPIGDDASPQDKANTEGGKENAVQARRPLGAKPFKPPNRPSGGGFKMVRNLRQ